MHYGAHKLSTNTGSVRMSEETTGAESKPKTDHFKRFNGMRPRSYDKSLPMYSPERDYGEVAKWLTSLYHVLQTQTPDYWASVIEKLGMKPYEQKPKGAALSEELSEAFKLLVGFLEQARGLGIINDIKEVPPDELLSFREALEILRSGNKAAMTIVTSMLGFVALDAMFFAARQDAYLGEAGPRTIDRMMPLLVRYGQAVLSNRPEAKVAADAIASAIELALSCGMSMHQINSLVAETLNENAK